MVMLAVQGRREGCFGEAGTTLSELPDTWGQVHQPVAVLVPYHPAVPRKAALQEPTSEAEHTIPG